MYNTIIGIGPPKTGTTYISRFFSKQGGYRAITNHCFEFHKNILNITDFNFVFGKNPDIIYYWHTQKIFHQWINHILQHSNNVLFICTMRPYNDCMYSIYKHRLRNNMIKKNISYLDYKTKEKSNLLNLETNLTNFYELLVSKNSGHSMVILNQTDLAQYETVSLLNSIGIEGLKQSEYPFDDLHNFTYSKEWKEHKEYRPKGEDFEFDQELEDSYAKIKQNGLLNDLTYTHKTG
jgi:hypothetical protein